MPNTDRDRFVNFVGIETVECRFGFSRVRCAARDSLLNGLDIAHGGFLFTLADFACALATNAEGRTAVSSNSSINYLAPCPADTVVAAEASFAFSDSKTALCDVKIYDEKTRNLFAVFQSRLIFKR